MNRTVLIPIVNALESDRGNLPKEIKLFPLGLVKSQKGNFLVDDESFQSILRHFKSHGVDIPIDYEHQTLHNVEAPAAGWIKALSMRPDGVYGSVEWTARAAQYLAKKEYRYLSPVVSVRENDRKALKLHSVALTNTPAIDGMTAIVNSAKPSNSDEVPSTGMGEDDSKQHSSSGNDEQVDVDAFINTLREMLKLPDDAPIADIASQIAELIQARNALSLEVNSLRFEAHKDKAEEAVLTALKEGKIMPFQKDWAFSSAMTNLESFKSWVESAPQVVPMGEIAFEPLTLKDGKTCSRAHELLGLTADDVKRYGGGFL